ncbi:MAG: GNAT family N-acetyltransferase [Hyphomicrobiaceae bacterium]
MPDGAPSQPSSLVRELEERAFNAWPALQTLLCGGWVIRLSEGYTKRANSINAWQPAHSLPDILAHAGPIYAARGLPCIVRLTPLASPGDDAFLAARGFTAADETLVMTAALSAQPRPADPSIVVEHVPAPAWLDGFAAANAVPAGRRAVHDRMVGNVPPPAAFARLEQDGRTLAWGLAVVERGMAGLFDIVTLPGARRQGLGRRLVEGLLAWSGEQGASQAYLQVVAANEPAIALYRRLGFTEAYRYHYRIEPR